MSATRQLVLASLIAVHLAACAAPNAPGATGGRAGARPKAGQAGAQPPPPAATAPGSGAAPVAPADAANAGVGPASGKSPLPTSGAGLVANNGATLTGKVKLPAGLVSDLGSALISVNGSLVVSNNGSSLISNNGGAAVGRYGLRALEQVTLGGATVRLVNAAGEPVRDAAGEPITTTTATDGTYAFTQALPANNLLVEVELPAGKGTLRAIAPASAAARASVDVELVGTLTTAYILSKFVRPQGGDLQATLDRLPADVERATRASAEAALTGAGAAVPSALTEAATVAAVEQLRASSSALDQQLEAVRKLLVAAGLSDLGNGRPATEVNQLTIRGATTANGGRIYWLNGDSARVWQLDGEGRMRTAAGVGAGDAGKIDGLDGPAAPLGHVVAIATAADDGLLILEASRLSRLGPDGKLAVLAENAFGPGRARGLAVGADGAIHVLAAGQLGREEHPDYAAARKAGNKALMDYIRSGRPRTVEVIKHRAALWSGAGGAPIARTLELGDDATRRLQHAARLLPAAGGLEVVTHGYGSPRRATLDPATGTLGKDAPWVEPVDAAGDPKVVPAEGQLVFSPDGKLFQGRGGKAVLIAGLREAPRAGRADQISFKAPTLLAADSGGVLRLYDEGSRWLWRVTPGGDARVVLELPDTIPEGPPDEGGGVTPAPQHLRATSDGATWFLNGDGWDARVVRVGPTGDMQIRWAPEPYGGAEQRRDLTLKDFDVTDDGTLTLLFSEIGTDPNSGEWVSRVVLQVHGPGGPPVEHEVLGPPEDSWFSAERFVRLGDGGYLVSNSSGFLAWRPGQDRARPVLAEPDQDWGLYVTGWSNQESRYMRDGAGRIYGTSNVQVWRWSAAGGFEVLAGEGGKFFRGEGVDARTGYLMYSPCLDGAGNLYFIDPESRQVKRIDAAELR